VNDLRADHALEIAVAKIGQSLGLHQDQNLGLRLENQDLQNENNLDQNQEPHPEEQNHLEPVAVAAALGTTDDPDDPGHDPTIETETGTKTEQPVTDCQNETTTTSTKMNEVTTRKIMSAQNVSEFLGLIGTRLRGSWRDVLKSLGKSMVAF